MPNPENIMPHRFQKGQSGNPNGRPKSRVKGELARIMPRSKAAKFTGMTVQELQEWECALLTMRLDELTVLAKEKDAPVYVRGLAMALLHEAKDGKSAALNRLRENVFGKALQRMEVTGADGADLLQARVLTKEEAQQLWKDMDKEY